MFAELSLFWLFALFGAAGVVVLACGLKMTELADRIADRTGLGEALIGGVLLGAATSLSGSVVSLTAALDGQASLAFSNGIGGIAAQTAFLAIADITYRRANLEHASAELANLFQGALLMVLLTIPLIAYTAPPVSFWGIHPASVAIFGVYAGGLVAMSRVREAPMWTPVDTAETREDRPDDAESRKHPLRLLLVFAAMAILLSAAGWTIARTGAAFTTRLGLSATLVGALMTAVVTSIPELVTTIGAVRRGALQLAVGGIIGGNTFDTLFLVVSDIGYRDGSIYHAVQTQDYFWLAVGLLMTGVLLMGLMQRERHGVGGIGWESVALILLYAGAVAVQIASG